MAYQHVELIIMRQLASMLAMPIFIVDPHGTLLYYNEPAEAILGHRFEDSGEVPLSSWTTEYVAVDEKGVDIPPMDLPLVIALKDKKPAHRAFWINGKDHVRRHIEVTAFPLIGSGDISLGAVAIFWEDRNK